MYTVNSSDFKLDCIALLGLIALMAVLAQQVIEGNLVAAIIGGIIGFTLYPPLTSLTKSVLMIRRCISQPLEYEMFTFARARLIETLDELLEGEANRSLMMPDGKWMRISRHLDVFTCRVERFVEEVYSAEGAALLQYSHRYVIHRNPSVPITMLYDAADPSENSERAVDPLQSNTMGDTAPLILQLFNPMNLLRLFRNDPVEIATQVSGHELAQLSDELCRAA